MTLEFEPGPFFVRDTAPDPDWPGVPGRFARLGAGVENHLATSDLVLGAAARDIASTDDGDLDRVFASTIGAAADVYEQEKDGDGDQTPNVLIVNGGTTEVLHAQVQPHLPPSTTTITTDFAEAPPAPQAGAPGTPEDNPQPGRPDVAG